MSARLYRLPNRRLLADQQARWLRKHQRRQEALACACCVLVGVLVGLMLAVSL